MTLHVSKEIPGSNTLGVTCHCFFFVGLFFCFFFFGTIMVNVFLRFNSLLFVTGVRQSFIFSVPDNKDLNGSKPLTMSVFRMACDSRRFASKEARATSRDWRGFPLIPHRKGGNSSQTILGFVTSSQKSFGGVCSSTPKTLLARINFPSVVRWMPSLAM